MTYAFTDDRQVEEFSHFDYVEEMNESIRETDHDDWNGIDDCSDDGYALASAGFGTDEDYGC